MRLCRDDPLLRVVFDHYHAHPLRIPESRIQPLSMFIRLDDDKVSWIGRLDEAVVPEFAERVKSLKRDEPSRLADVEAQRSSMVDMKAGLDILGGLIAAFKVESCLPAVHAQFGSFRQVAFAFSDVTREGFSPLALGGVLPSEVVPFDTSNAVIYGWLRSRRPVAYLVDSVLASPGFRVEVGESTNVSVALDHVPINALVDESAGSRCRRSATRS